jgi:hypothetical protein
VSQSVLYGLQYEYVPEMNSNSEFSLCHQLFPIILQKYTRIQVMHLTRDLEFPANFIVSIAIQSDHSLMHVDKKQEGLKKPKLAAARSEFPATLNFKSSLSCGQPSSFGLSTL